MKKLILTSSLIVSIMFGAFNCAYCAPDAKSAAAAKAALKEKFKSNIEKKDNGDVFLKEFPNADFSKLKNAEKVGPVLLLFLSYVDTDIDFEALNKSISRETGDKKGAVPIKSIMAGIGRYLGRNNMQLQKVSVSGSGIEQKIDDGVPLIAWLSASDIYDKTMVPRTKKRMAAKNIDEWTKEMKKLEVKRMPRDRTFTRALITGYNKKSGEYLVLGVSEKPVWLTEKELKGCILEAYQLRF